jgi:anti-sigma regulatory factor (Ser/Thr protein kinase)
MISVSADLPAAILDLPADVPIGVTSDRRRRTSTVALPPGTAVCLYTDGLVERRRRSLDDGLDRLANAMFAGPAESVCATIMKELVGSDPPADDIALLVLRRQPQPGTDGDALELELPAAPSSLKPLRIAMRRWLEHIRAGRQATADLLVAVGEACSNAIEHAYGPSGGSVSVCLSFEPPDVIALVVDTGRWREPRGRFRGRGITLMRALSDEVTIDRSDTGTRVRIRRTTEEGVPR